MGIFYSYDARYVPCSSRHLQQTVSTCVQRLLQRAHVLKLLQIDAIIGKEHIESVQIEPHNTTMVVVILRI